MNTVLFIAGIGIGLFLWSNIWGSIFATLPVQLNMKRQGVTNRISWYLIIGPLVISGLIIVLTSVFLKSFFYGSLVSCVIMIFNISKLKSEAQDNFDSELARKQT